MQEQLITFETAKLAKGKGFDWKCKDWFKKNGESDNLNAYTWNSNEGNQVNFLFTRPTQSLLQKWLREVKNIDVIVLYQYGTDKERKYDVETYSMYVEEEEFEEVEYNSYEEALEDGLQEALKLIP